MKKQSKKNEKVEVVTVQIGKYKGLFPMRFGDNLVIKNVTEFKKVIVRIEHIKNRLIVVDQIMGNMKNKKTWTHFHALQQRVASVIPVSLTPKMKQNLANVISDIRCGR